MHKDKKSFFARPGTLAAIFILIFFACTFVSAAISYFSTANEWGQQARSEYPKTEEYIASIKKSNIGSAPGLYNIDFKKIAVKASSVFIKGDFNSWQQEKLSKNKDGEWAIRKALAPGEYRFIYIVDNKEQLDDFRESREVDSGFKRSKGISAKKVSFITVRKH